MNTKVNAAADRMKSQMTAARRKIGLVQLCECGEPAHPQSCYCDACESQFCRECGNSPNACDCK